jgi:hypothetical protein
MEFCFKQGTDFFLNVPVIYGPITAYGTTGVVAGNALTVATTGGSVAVNIAGIRVLSQLRDQPGGNLIATLNSSVLATSSGVLHLSIPASTSVGITPGIYYFDTLATLSGSTSLLLEGKMRVEPAVSVAALVAEGSLFSHPGVTSSSENPMFYTTPQGDVPGGY